MVKKRYFLDSEMELLGFPGFGLCRGRRGSQLFPDETTLYIYIFIYIYLYIYRGPIKQWKAPVLPSRSVFAMWPKMITHTYSIIWEVMSQLHMTSVTQGFLAGILLYNLGAFANHAHELFGN